ncbi:MAG: XRE family transcriptional regulator, partial [candidate division Zixibacteria bacterium]|nr:XRE family transcriptional regulator [candidate division Zixibacteria bacterium]
MTYTDKTMLKAMIERNQSFDGKFYVGVLSTGIYCLPSCKAKNPKRENVRFFPSREEAVAAGLRGCKRCRSDRYPDVLPDWVKRLIKHLRENRTVRITETDLADIAGVNISTIRRHFKAHLGMTALAFNRYQRLLHAREMLTAGENYLSAAFA